MNVLRAAVLPTYVIIVETQLTMVRQWWGKAHQERQSFICRLALTYKSSFVFCSSTIVCQLFCLFLTCVCTVSSVSAYLLSFVNCLPGCVLLPVSTYLLYWLSTAATCTVSSVSVYFHYFVQLLVLHSYSGHL